MAVESVFLVGNGGREHAFAEAISASPHAPEMLYATPGNVGVQDMDHGALRATTLDYAPTDINGIVGFVDTMENKSGLTVVVGPEAPLIAGLGDRLREQGVAVFGPSAEAAQLEGSKIFATDFMRRHSIPHPRTAIIRTQEEATTRLLGVDPETIVLKADGLAGGKGVVLPKTNDELHRTAKTMLDGEAFDGAGKNGFLIQERLTGPEVSVFVVADGKGGFSTIPYFAQDHKRLLEGDEGPNTGGMGAYAPLPDGYLTEQQQASIEKIAQQTIEGMQEDGTPYQGVLYLGLMMAEEYGGSPVVIEYNCRFGDPEAQVIMPLMTSSGIDVYETLYSSARGETPRMRAQRHIGDSALTVTLAAAGYPDAPRKGDPVSGLGRDYPDTRIYHAGTKRQGDGLIATNGGRVLYATGIGRGVDKAADAAYAAIGQDGVHFPGMQYRRDIGHRIRTQR